MKDQKLLWKAIPPIRHVLVRWVQGWISLQERDDSEKKLGQDSKGLSATLTPQQRPERTKKMLIDIGALGVSGTPSPSHPHRSRKTSKSLTKTIVKHFLIVTCPTNIPRCLVPATWGRGSVKFKLMNEVCYPKRWHFHCIWKGYSFSFSLSLSFWNAFLSRLFSLLVFSLEAKFFFTPKVFMMTIYCFQIGAVWEIKLFIFMVLL